MKLLIAVSIAWIWLGYVASMMLIENHLAIVLRSCPQATMECPK